MPSGEKSSKISPEDQIARFTADHEAARNLGGYAEETASCTRVVAALVRSDSLTVLTLSAIFQRAHDTIPGGATYHLAYHALEAAAASGKLTAELFTTVEQSVMADISPLWGAIGMQEQANRKILQQLLINDGLFAHMLPYLL